MENKHSKSKHDASYEDQECECEKHPPECAWHKDWHACDCGLFDVEQKNNT